MNFSEIPALIEPLLIGAVTTVEITLVSLLVAVVIGLSFALIKLSRLKALHWLIDIYVEIFRGTPVLAQLFIIYFGLAYLGIRVNAFPAAIIGLGLNGGAVLTEVFRAGLAAIHHGQREAALSVGMTPWSTMRYIILPQTWRITLPPLGNYVISMFKDSPLLSAITLLEMLRRATIFGKDTFRYLEPYTLVGLAYLTLSLAASWLVGRLERRMGQPGGRPAHG